MRLTLLFGFLILSQPQFAQIFTEKPSEPIFENVYTSSIAFSDVDGDNDQDVFISGRINTGERIAKLYTNDGKCIFTQKKGTPFDGVQLGSIAFSDVDGDNDQDLLTTGLNNSFELIAKMYTNDGMGNFSEITGTPFDGVYNSAIAFMDVDADNDQDVLITGQKYINLPIARIAKLYANDGMGNFTEMMDTPFEGVTYSSIAFSDVDGDNDQDVFVTGYNNSNERIAKLYTNDGMGIFSEKAGTPFEGVQEGSIAFSDVDSDNDQDVLITGRNNSFEAIAKLYTNDGLGNFAEKAGTPFMAVILSSITFSDVDGDNDQDLLITGQNDSDEGVSKLYTNDGIGNFTENSGTAFDSIYSGSIAFSDVDGDNDQDVLITGRNHPFQGITNLYTNDGNGNFTKKTGTPFDHVYDGSIAFSDVDSDNDQDVLITGGKNNIDDGIAKLYTNDGMGNFTEKTNNLFEGVGFKSSIAFSDVDGDNDQDVLITGRNGLTSQVAKLYINDGLGNFTEKAGTPFDGVMLSSIAITDVDGDNDQDVLITGQNHSGTGIAKLYTNDGMGNFTEKTGTPFDGVMLSSIAFSDVDGDGDQDVLITGRNNLSEGIAKLYTNNGIGNFTEKTGTPFESVYYGSIAFSDVDGDNDQDVLITGQNNPLTQIAKLYANDGAGNFSEISGTPFDGVQESSIAFSDVDGDNDQDVLISGAKYFDFTSELIAKLYTNDGMGNFSEMMGTPFEGVMLSSIAFSDLDGDNDQDVLITGRNNFNEGIAKLYTNNGIVNSTDDLILSTILQLKSYPNPITSNVLNVSFNSIENGLAIVKVFDLNGHLLSQQKELTTVGQQIISIDMTALSSGYYIVQLETGKRKGVTKFFVP
jgi:predicted nucleotidyltransferase